MKVPGWDQAVQKWAWDKQKEMYEDNYEEGEFPDLGDWVRFGGWYTDPGDLDGAVLNKFFTQSGTDPDYEKDKNVTNTTEEDQGPTVIEQWEAQMEETLEAYNGRYDHSSLWGEIDEGDDPEHPMMWYTGQFQVQFDVDLFGDDAGAEYEVESLDDWRSTQDFEKVLREEMDARGMYKYFDELTFESGYGHRANVSFRFDIARDDYDGNPAGLDSFAEYVESDWDNDYDEIRAVLRRALINEGYMAPLPVDKLAAAEPDDFKFWDIDVDDGGSVSIRLDTPEMAAGGAPYKYRPGIFVGELPAGMQLEKVFTDWRHAGHSWEFTNAFVPKIRALFDEAEKYVQQQLDLPGMEQEEDILGLLIPSRATWRLEQTWKDYSEPARIFLQVQLDVGEDVDETGMEEIEHFIKYLDRQEALDIIHAAAVETFQEAIEPAKTRVQKEKKIASFREELNTKLMTIPLKELLSLATNMKAPSNMLADARDALSWMSRTDDSRRAMAQYGYPTMPEDFDAARITAEQIGVWIIDLDEFLDQMNRGEITAFNPQYAFDPAERKGEVYWVKSFRHREAQAEAGPTGRLKIKREEQVPLPYFFLPQHARGELRSLWGGLKDLIPNMINKMQDMANTYSGDPFDRASYYTTPSNREMADARWLPQWWVPLMYKYEFFDPEMSFDDEVIAALQQKQKETAEKADPQKKFELKESLSLLDRINTKLREAQDLFNPDAFDFEDPEQKMSAAQSHKVATPAPKAAAPTPTKTQVPAPPATTKPKEFDFTLAEPADEDIIIEPESEPVPAALAAPPVAADPDWEEFDAEDDWEEDDEDFDDWDEKDIQTMRDKYEKSYSDPAGVNREIWIDALADSSHPLGKFDGNTEAASEYYEREVLPHISRAIQKTPMKGAPKDFLKLIKAFGAGAPERGMYNPVTQTIHPKIPGRGVAGHETFHAVDDQGVPGPGWLSGKQRDLIRQTLGMQDVVPPPKPGKKIPHHKWTAEQYTDIKKHHAEVGRFTPEQLEDIKNGNYRDSKGWSYPDLQNALLDAEMRGAELDLEKVAKGLNRVAVREPKPQKRAPSRLRQVRPEPNQMVAESKKRRKIRIRIKKR